MDALSQAKTLLQDFKQAVNVSSPSLENCKNILAKLKIVTTQFLFPTEGQDSQEVAKLELAREILEQGAFFSATVNDTANFDRYAAQVKNYYYDYGKKLKPSEHQFEVLGLLLLRLLSENRMDEFHTELELIPFEQHANKFIQFPVLLEQAMMEGAYNKVGNASQHLPSTRFAAFVGRLMDTVRDEIADCLEAAYENLSLSEAQKLLRFPSTDKTTEFCVSRGWSINQAQKIIFEGKEMSEKQRAEIPTRKIISQTLTYARELERII